ncbi:MAG: alpha/beta fold hydrolase, partial [Steroidobacteraceae bacterium]
MIEAQRKKMTLPDGDVSYLEWPSEAPRIHFSHANGFNAETYRDLLTPLAGRFRVTAADMRGHGFTTLPATPEARTDWRIFGSDLAALLDRLDPAPFYLAGHSMGAIASLMVAARYPARVKGIVLVEPVLVPRFSRMRQRLMRLMGIQPPRGTDLAALAIKRRAIFPSFEMALASYRGRGAFAT